MRVLLLLLFLTVVFKISSQDKLYLLSGECKNVRVTEIGIDEVKFETDSSNEIVLKETILLIEYKNGTLDVFNRAPESKIINLNSVNKKQINNQNKALFNYNLVSFNSLALCNADASVFFERILQNKKIGMGVMAAYNFNVEAISPNINIVILNGAKKNYDLGLFCNVYKKRFIKKTSLSYGIMFKQTNFSFNSVAEDSIKTTTSTGVNITYTKSKGNQFATLFNFGTHTMVLPNFFIKTYFGVGGFNLRGNYKQQYNYEINKASNSNTNQNGTPAQLNVTFLPKLYVGINLGYAF